MGLGGVCGLVLEVCSCYVIFWLCGCVRGRGGVGVGVE